VGPFGSKAVISRSTQSAYYSSKGFPSCQKNKCPTQYIYIPVSTKPRYDLFYKASLLEAVGDIKKAYQEFAKNIRANLPECQAGKAI
jgi:hypothetical protein